MTWVRLANVTRRAERPICRATSVAPCSRGVSESRVPDMISTGSRGGTSGGLRTIGEQPGRDRPAQAPAVGLGVLVKRRPLGQAERREGVLGLAAQRRAVLLGPDRGRSGPAKQLHVVGAGDGEVKPVAVFGQR